MGGKRRQESKMEDENTWISKHISTASYQPPAVSSSPDEHGLLSDFSEVFTGESKSPTAGKDHAPFGGMGVNLSDGTTPSLKLYNTDTLIHDFYKRLVSTLPNPFCPTKGKALAALPTMRNKQPLLASEKACYHQLRPGSIIDKDNFWVDSTKNPQHENINGFVSRWCRLRCDIDEEEEDDAVTVGLGVLVFMVSSKRFWDPGGGRLGMTTVGWFWIWILLSRGSKETHRRRLTGNVGLRATVVKDVEEGEVVEVSVAQGVDDVRSTYRQRVPVTGQMNNKTRFDEVNSEVKNAGVAKSSYRQ